MTKAETFLWYSATPDLRLGVAHLWEQNAFRWLAAYRLLPETATRPSVHASAGVQGIGTGNPGYSLTAEKNFAGAEGSLNVFAGVGFRSNENHAHPVAGMKYSFTNGLTLGVQHDGHETHPFVTFSRNKLVVGFYLIDGKAPAYMVGARF